jgi:hypothetical protein
MKIFLAGWIKLYRKTPIDELSEDTAAGAAVP